jgi:hypothetical protein
MRTELTEEEFEKMLISLIESAEDIELRELARRFLFDAADSDELWKERTEFLHCLFQEDRDLSPDDLKIRIEQASSQQGVFNTPASQSNAEIAPEPEGRSSQIEIRERGNCMVPRKHLKMRFGYKDEIFSLRANQALGYWNGDLAAEIPDTFPFSYEMEMTLLGIFNLLQDQNYGYHFVDRGHGYFPASIGKKIFFVNLRRQKDLFEAIGMVERRPSVYAGEEKVKQAFSDLITYQHPVIHKRTTGEVNEEGKEIVECVASNELLFRLFQYDRLINESSFRPAVLRRDGRGGWKLRGSLKKSVIMLNPTFWPADITKKPRLIESSLYSRIEESRKRLSRAEGKRYWKKDPLFFRFGYYLLHLGGSRTYTSTGRPASGCSSELWTMLKKLGLWERYGEDEGATMVLLDRACQIYKDMGYLHEYEWRPARRHSKRKLRLVRNLEKFPHMHASSGTLLPH